MGSSAGYHRARGAGFVGHRGGDRGERLVKALLKVLRVLQQAPQIEYRTATESVLSSQMIKIG